VKKSKNCGKKSDRKGFLSVVKHNHARSAGFKSLNQKYGFES